MTVSQVSAFSERLQSVEAYRKKALRAYKTAKTFSKPLKVVYVIAAIMAGLCSLLPLLLPVFLPFIIPALGLFIGETLLFSFIFKDPEKRYEARYKQDIIVYFFKTFFPELTHEPEKFISSKAISFSRLFGRKIERHFGSDKLDGRRDGKALQFSCLQLQQTKYGLKEFMEDAAELVMEIIFQPEPGDGPENLVTVYRGMLFRLHFHMSFPGSVIFQPRGDNWMKLFVKKSYLKGRTEILTKDESFDHVFRMYASPDIDLGEILSADFRQNLIKLNGEVSSNLGVSVVNGHLFIALPDFTHLMTPFLKKPVSDLASFQSFLEAVDMIQSVGSPTPTQAVDTAE